MESPPENTGGQDSWRRAREARKQLSYREAFVNSGTGGDTDFELFAKEWLAELQVRGYYGVELFSGYPVRHVPEPKFSSDPYEPVVPPVISEKKHPICFENTNYTLWLQLDGPRTAQGYRSVEVAEEPVRGDVAILAAVTSVEYRTMDLQRLRRALAQLNFPLKHSVSGLWKDTLDEDNAGILPEGHRREILDDLQHGRSLDYVLTLLRYHRPGFDELPPQEQRAYILATCERANAAVGALRNLMDFLAHGSPYTKNRPATRTAARDVQAAVLERVEGLDVHEIGRRLGLPPPRHRGGRGDHPTVERMIERGKDYLHRALGESGWERQADAMRMESFRWQRLSDDEKKAEVEKEARTLVHLHGISFEEALSRVTKENEHRGERGESEPLDP